MKKKLYKKTKYFRLITVFVCVCDSMSWTNVDIFMQADARPQKQASRNNGMSPVTAKNFFILLIKTKWSEEEKQNIPFIPFTAYSFTRTCAPVLYSSHSATRHTKSSRSKNAIRNFSIGFFGKINISLAELKMKTKQNKRNENEIKTNEVTRTDRDEEKHVEKMSKVFETICI